MTTSGRRYAVNSVFPPAHLADRAVRAKLVPSALRHTAEAIDGIPRHRPWRIGNIRYGAFIVPRDITQLTYRSHPLDGKLVTEDEVDQLLADMMHTVDEINHLGTWAVEAFGDVIFEDQAP